MPFKENIFDYFNVKYPPELYYEAEDEKNKSLLSFDTKEEAEKAFKKFNKDRDEEAFKIYSDYIEKRDKPMIGYCYTTTNTSWNMKAKQMPKEIMLNFIKEHPEFNWVSLQQDEGYITSDLWVDTADKVQALDGVISVDSAIAHIAGSVGVPVANLIGQGKLSCWRWYPALETTYWYDSMKTVWFEKWEDGLKEAIKHFKKEQVCNVVNDTGNKGKTKTTTRARPAGTTGNNKRGAGRKI